jgi:hypothetical protein
MKKRKARFNSLSTPGLRVTLENYLVELAFLRSNYNQKLPEKFWQSTRHKYKYRREIQAVKKFLNKFGETDVLRAAIEHLKIVSWADYGKVEAILQTYAERRELRARPKDLTPVKKRIKNSVDLRPKDDTVKKPKGLFKRLK